jgi:hypothetical protein
MNNHTQNKPAGLARREFLAASAGAAFALNLDGVAFAEADQTLSPVEPRSTVAVEAIAGGVLLIGIDREPENRVDPATFVALGKALYRLDHDDSLHAGVLYGRGPNFTPGIDVPAWAATLSAGPFNPNTKEFVNPVPPQRMKPMVAAVHGAAKYFGHELFLSCDVRVAASDTVFCQGEVTRGLFPGGGATIRFTREAGWGNAMRMGCGGLLSPRSHAACDAARRRTRSRDRFCQKDRGRRAARRPRDAHVGASCINGRRTRSLCCAPAGIFRALPVGRFPRTRARGARTSRAGLSRQNSM